VRRRPGRASHGPRAQTRQIPDLAGLLTAAYLDSVWLGEQAQRRAVAAGASRSCDGLASPPDRHERSRYVREPLSQAVPDARCSFIPTLRPTSHLGGSTVWFVLTIFAANGAVAGISS
jgi:hypothetical protein